MVKAMLIVTIVLYALWFVALVVALAGAGASTSACTDVLKIFYEGRTGGRRLTSVLTEITNRRGNLKGSAQEECGDIYGSYWWGVCFQLLCVVLAVLPALGLGFAKRFQHGLVVLLGICTAYLMTGCINLKDTIKYYDLNKPEQGRGKKDIEDMVVGMQVLLAGYILLIILNIIYIFCNLDSQESLVWTFRPNATSRPNTPASYGAAQPSKAAPAMSVAPTSQPSGGIQSPQVHVAAYDETNLIAPPTKFGPSDPQGYAAPPPYASYPPPAGPQQGYPPAGGRPNQSFA